MHHVLRLRIPSLYFSSKVENNQIERNEKKMLRSWKESFRVYSNMSKINKRWLTLDDIMHEKRAGFGSFHSEDVEQLIRKSKEDYFVPNIYQHITKVDPSGEIVNNENNISSFPFTNSFGEEVKNNLFHIGEKWDFLNHGAFGSVLKHLLDEASAWQIYCESQPLRFFDRKLLPLIVYSLREMSNFINCPATGKLRMTCAC